MSPWREQHFLDKNTASSRPLAGCSACLLGEPVRYDGDHKLQSSIEQWLADWLQLQAVCPGVGIGLPVPRPTLKVITRERECRVVGTVDETRDVTDALRGYADEHLQQIGRFWPLCGWIFKARSPSCGRGSTVINPGARGESVGSGAFAGRFRTVEAGNP